MEIECLNFGQDEFTKNFNNKDQGTLQFYDHLSYDRESVEKVLDRPVHPHTEKLAGIIRSDMEQYGLSDAQRENIEKLKAGHRVIIGGQQAGLFMSPSYIMHKIITLLVLTEEVKAAHDYDAVPVFWVAGEDHDFAEVNHTYIYDKHHRRRRKISYKPNLTVPMSLGFYRYDAAEMERTLLAIIEACGDSGLLYHKKSHIIEMIHRHEYWTELFHALVHDVFKEEGLLIFNAHSEAVRAFEVPMFEQMINHHEDIDRSFRSGQKKFNETLGLSPMIETETNVHLFTGSEGSRTLLMQQDGRFETDKGTIDKEALIERLGDAPETFSNNVVTRPLMQEMLFNTLIFAGGGAEVKYWGELHEVFQSMGMPMPIVLKRMEIIHEDMRLGKLLDKYDLQVSNTLHADVENRKNRLVEEATDQAFLDEVDAMKTRLEDDYRALSGGDGRERYGHLIEANMKVHQKQLAYLKRRYRLEVKKALRSRLNDLEEVAERVMPGGALQERVYHPWMFPGIDHRNLSYTTKLTIIKGV
ncbi:bacillithiol biosynthesis cysteine-adding enzyme BshC [Salinicoccus sp. ID82-1]|uniref:Putative cysteine ligase BshC n=1 Tax=Salinicoccus cyprini TaxID=2493691 RepID=A0A558AXX3_9STAP|nr:MULTISPECIES: bacillithiol biosynthesis cysteine-adding enzyme BshC [Salinicoccus]MCG1008633.1 bacillithiol biosynthesis cysteine-adding enzyme BshC [Salinicoccus sp. ID82-1]TVT29111.1 bacillithiol biosynthesis cysteine-adding enzyme BshC [Salinicoccus cyprini]